MAENELEDGIRVVVDRKNVPKSPNFVDLYVNDTYVQTSVWDVRLMFAILTEQTPDQNAPSPLRIADVRMSLQHAKRVATLMTMQIEQYEKDNGPIFVPPTPKNEKA